MRVLRNTGMGFQILKSSLFWGMRQYSVIISYCEVIMDTNELRSRNASLLDFLGVFFISSLDLLQHAC